VIEESGGIEKGTLDVLFGTLRTAVQDFIPSSNDVTSGNQGPLLRELASATVVSFASLFCASFRDFGSAPQQ
jgi:hypothetical protein